MNKLLSIFMGLCILVFSQAISPEQAFAQDGGSVLEVLQPKAKKAFDNAEKKHLGTDEGGGDEVGPNPDASKCPCKGTGRILQGDGHYSPCPYHAKSDEPQVVHDPVVEVEVIEYRKHPKNTKDYTHYQVVIFSAKWCGPCQQMKKEITPELTRLGFEVADTRTADVRIMDIDVPEYRQFYNTAKGMNRNIPLFVEIKNNKLIRTLVKDTGRKTVAQILNKYDLEK